MNNINLVYQMFKIQIEDENQSSKEFSIQAIIIDAFSFIELAEFFRENNNIFKTKRYERTSNKMMVLAATFTHEIFNFIKNEYPNIFEEKPDLKIQLKIIKSLRDEIKQYEFKTYDKLVGNISRSMGRSTNSLEPMLDILIYLNNNLETKFYGTNNYLFNKTEIKTLEVYNASLFVLEQIISYFSIEKQPTVLKPVLSKTPVKVYSYSYVDIIKSNQTLNETEIEILLFFIDDLASVHELFNYIIDINENLIESPYLIYFFRKLIAVTLDQTFDNIQKYIRHSDNEENKEKFQNLLLNISSETIEKYRKYRNNIHYTKQDKIKIGDAKESYWNLIQDLKLIEDLINKISTILKIQPSFSKLLFYKFLAFAGSSRI